MGRYLIVTWDGAGNLVPTLGITRELIERGHDVRMLAHDTIAERCGDVGARFVPLTQPKGWDAMEDPDDFEAEVKLLIEELCFSSTIGRDVAQELDREPADAVLVDCMLFTAIDLATASGTPTAALFHTPYTIFRGGPLVEMFAPGMAIANAHRVALDLPALESLGGIHDACAAAIVAVPREFEPDAPDAPNVLRIGPVLDAPPLSRDIDEVDVRDGSMPLVVVSLSTSEQGQADLLQRCVDGVARLPVARHRDDRSVDRSRIRERRRKHAGGAIRAARHDPPLGVTGDHARRPRHHAGRTRSRSAAAVHTHGPRSVLQRRAGPGPRRGSDAAAGLQQRRHCTGRNRHPRRRPLQGRREANGRRDGRLRRCGGSRCRA